jgi:alkanesulfonate monooxygenase SsuD/methylene tetrahydromethanopterin reductase-like flavin-dependent oxidoreductase (luciferase family)
MDFGIFTEQIRRGSSQGEWFDELLDLADAGEQWGLDVVWLAEMLVNPARSVLSAPLLVASWIVARTRRLRVGTAVQLLPLNHPLRVAGEVATLDHLSHGRFDFGIGRGGGPRAYDALGVPYEESQARFFEALEVILTAWKGGALQLHGQVLSLQRYHGDPRPYRRCRTCSVGWRSAPPRRFHGRPDGSADLRGPSRDGHSGAGRAREALSRSLA